MPEDARVRMGAGADGVDADVDGSEVGGEVAHGGFKGGLGDAHHVVVGDHFFGAVVGHADDGGAGVEQGFKGLAEGHEGVGGHVEGELEAVAGGIEVAALEVVLGSEGHGMDEHVHLAPLFLHEFAERAMSSSLETSQGKVKSPESSSEMGSTRFLRASLR